MLIAKIWVVNWWSVLNPYLWILVLIKLVAKRKRHETPHVGNCPISHHGVQSANLCGFRIMRCLPFPFLFLFKQISAWQINQRQGGLVLSPFWGLPFTRPLGQSVAQDPCAALFTPDIFLGSTWGQQREDELCPLSMTTLDHVIATHQSEWVSFSEEPLFPTPLEGKSGS